MARTKTGAGWTPKKRNTGKQNTTIHLKKTPNIPPKSAVQALRQAASDAKQFGTHILFLFVGAQRELITIHSALLPQETITYIEEVNRGQQLFQLPGEDIGIVKIHQSFLYSGQIPSIGNNDQERRDTGRADAHNDAEWTRLVHCYFLGITVRDEKFANASITALIEKVKETDRFPSGVATEVHEYTEQGDRLRRLIVDLHVWFGQGSCIRQPHQDADGPREFLQDVVQGLAVAGPDVYDPEIGMPWELRCAYHLHDITPRCAH